MGAYGEHSSRLRNFEGFKLVTNLKETKEAKCKYNYVLRVNAKCLLWQRKVARVRVASWREGKTIV